jgi:hypothetical protein
MKLDPISDTLFQTMNEIHSYPFANAIPLIILRSIVNHPDFNVILNKCPNYPLV